ncbi:MAG: hypothetical protein WC608_02295 [Parcubacteria group bacterium]
MGNFIKVQDKNLFLLNAEPLGLPEAQLWIGKADGPADDEDQRVAKERVESTEKGEIYGIEAVDLKASENFSGWFEIDTSAWPVGIYRFNIHGRAGVSAPNGTVLQNSRDLQYSWPKFSDEDLLNLPEDQKEFLYLEKNKRGFCMRIEKKEDGELKPAGDGKNWIANWPEIKQEVENHMKEKIMEAKNPKGIVGLISLLIVVVIAALWMAYLMNKQNLGISKDEKGAENKGAQEQLDDLRTEMKSITDKKDKEIYDALK